MIQPQEKYMLQGIEAARQSGKNGDYAIGALVVKGDEVIAVGYESLKSANDPVNGHAEIDAIRKACSKLSQSYLTDCILYSTHEPCPMCMAACIWAKVDTVAFAVTRDDMIAEMDKVKAASGGKFSWRQISIPAQYLVDHGEPKVALVPGFMRDEGLKLFELTEQT